MSGGCHQPAARSHIAFKPESRVSISDRSSSQSWHHASQHGRRAAATVLKATRRHTAFCRKRSSMRTVNLHICRTMNSYPFIWQQQILLRILQPQQDKLQQKHIVLSVVASPRLEEFCQNTARIFDNIIYMRHDSPGSSSVHYNVPLVPPAARYLQPNMLSTSQADVMLQCRCLSEHPHVKRHHKVANQREGQWLITTYT